jgi:anti-sigma factor RsiW
MRGAGNGSKPPAGMPDAMPDALLWRQSRMTEAPESEEQGYLDLAGFADGVLDPDEYERVAERLAHDPVAASDVAAARALAGAGALPAADETVVARACEIVGRAEHRAGTVVLQRPRRPLDPGLRRMAGWGSLVAAMVVASWLGFTLGVDTSRSLTQVGQANEDGFLRELLDPATGFMRDLTEGTQT